MKHFASDNALQNHLNSKKHKEALAGLRSAVPSSGKAPTLTTPPAVSAVVLPPALPVSFGPASRSADALPFVRRRTKSASDKDATVAVLTEAAAAASLVVKDDDAEEEVDDDEGDEGATEGADAVGKDLGDEEEAKQVAAAAAAIAAVSSTFTLNDCIFCNHTEPSMEAVLNHMAISHSFFVPDLQFVADLPALLTYLHNKVRVDYICLRCNMRGKNFHSLEGVRRHMVDKGHCMVDYEIDGQFELEDFYDFSSSYPDYDGEWEDVEDAQGEDAEGDGAGDEMEVDERTLALGRDDSVPETRTYVDGMDLVLPSGARAGHRALRYIYRQKFRPTDDRDSVVIQRLMAQCVPPSGWCATTHGFIHRSVFSLLTHASSLHRYKAIGYHAPVAAVKRQWKDAERGRRRANLISYKVGWAKNNQKHHREEVLQ